MAKETHTKAHANAMRKKVVDKSLDNLKLGKSTRIVEGGSHAEELKKFWDNRKQKKGYIENNTPLGG